MFKTLCGRRVLSFSSGKEVVPRETDERESLGVNSIAFFCLGHFLGAFSGPFLGPFYS